MRRRLRNKSKVIIGIVFIIILISAVILTNYFSSSNNIITLAKNMFNAQTSNVVEKTTGGGLESAYIEWDSVDDATGYNVYICNVIEQTSYKQLDNELIRKYQDSGTNYWRADAVGLKAGEYKFKIVPIFNGEENTSKQFESENISVEAHDRTGFAWVNGETTGAYNMDGTLKENANVLYITEDTKNAVSLEVQTSSNGRTETAQGLQNILDLYKKGYETKPLDVRFIGKVTDPSVLEGGDIVISGSGSEERVNCGITIEGIGEDATLYGYGIRVKNATNVEIRNIAVMLTDSNEGDSIGLQQENDHVWVHNCDFFYGEPGSDSDQVKGDGALDCKKSTYITFSYNHFFDTGKSNLLGLSENKIDDLYITYHHNWYDHSDSRHPRIRFYSAHVYNNYYDGNSKYGVGACLGSSVLVEGNYFRNCKKPMMISMQGSDTSGTFSKEDGGMIKAYNNYMVGQDSYIPYSQNNKDFDAYEVSDIDEKVPNSVTSLKGGNVYNNFDTSSIMYEYEADSPEVAKEKVEKYAGRLNGGDFKWNFDDSKDDESDKLNDDLKKALENYESKLISVGGDSVDMPDTPEPEPEPEEIKVESVTLNSQNEELEIGEITTLVATITPSNATNKNVTWSSDNTDVATVDNGIVTAVGEGTANITVITQDGNKIAVCEIIVNKEIEEIISTISYDITEPTNENVTATITFNKEDVTITNNAGNNQYIFDENDEFTFEYRDAEGNTGTNTAKVNWIDKEAPIINVEYENINNGEAINVIIQSNERLVAIDGWTLSEDSLSMSKTFYENQTETVQISDLVGNVIETTIQVESIVEQPSEENPPIDDNTPEDENQTQNNVENTTENTNGIIDNTVANSSIPQTGVSPIITILIGITLLGMVICYIRYKKLKDIIK